MNRTMWHVWIKVTKIPLRGTGKNYKFPTNEQWLALVALTCNWLLKHDFIAGVTTASYWSNCVADDGVWRLFPCAVSGRLCQGVLLPIIESNDLAAHQENIR